MDSSSLKGQKRARRHHRIRARITGTKERPRLVVYRSNRFVYAQLVDDTTGTTVASADSRQATGKNASERAAQVGETLASAAKKQGIERVVFDRGGFRYQGIVASLAEGARKGGLAF